jgi:hypothetical protein
MQWGDLLERQRARYRDGEERLPSVEDSDARQRQLTRMGNAANGAALVLLMQANTSEAAEWFARAAARWRESWENAPPGSWGRPIGVLKALILADDWPGAEDAARWTLEVGAADADSPIARYGGCLATLVLGDDVQARTLADSLHGREDFPHAVADALRMVAAGDDLPGYITAVEAVLESFETREEYLEDVAVADTVVVLQALARRRGFEAELSSPVLPESRLPKRRPPMSPSPDARPG